MAFLSSDEVTKCIDFFDWNGQIYIVMEYMEQGALITEMCLEAS